MGIALVIVGGLVLMTAFAAGFDFLTKRRNKLDNETKQKVGELERKIAALELRATAKDDRIEQLETDFAFLNKLLEKK
jgi:hypothetical protein